MILAPQPLALPSVGPIIQSCVFAGFRRPRSEPTAEQWHQELAAIVRHRMAGLALQNARENGWTLPVDIQRALEDAKYEWSLRCLKILRESSPVLAELRNADISHVITKGPGIVGDIGIRPFTDLDIVVCSDTFSKALTVAAKNGYTEDQLSEPPWDSFKRLCREATNLHSEGGGSIDIHHRVPPWLWAQGLLPEALIAGSQTRDVSGYELPLASEVHNLLISALHIISDHGKPGQSLMPWRDVLALAHSCPAQLVFDEAQQAGLTGWLEWILTSYPTDLQPEELLSLLRTADDKITHRGRLRLETGSTWAADHQLGHALRLPSLRAIFFVCGMLVPSPKFLRRKFPETRHLYYRWWSQGLGTVSKMRLHAGAWTSTS